MNIHFSAKLWIAGRIDRTIDHEAYGIPVVVILRNEAVSLYSWAHGIRN